MLEKCDSIQNQWYILRLGIGTHCQSIVYTYTRKFQFSAALPLRAAGYYLRSCHLFSYVCQLFLQSFFFGLVSICCPCTKRQSVEDELRMVGMGELSLHLHLEQAEGTTSRFVLEHSTRNPISMDTTHWFTSKKISSLSSRRTPRNIRSVSMRHHSSPCWFVILAQLCFSN